MPYIFFSGNKTPIWHNSGAVSTSAYLTQILLRRYTAGFISDNNYRRIFSEVKY